MYQGAFNALHAHKVRHLPMADRAAAEDEELAHAIATAKGIFITGGDQKRLMTIIGGTRCGNALRQAWLETAPAWPARAPAPRACART
jgi:cyanophycinase